MDTLKRYAARVAGVRVTTVWAADENQARERVEERLVAEGRRESLEEWRNAGRRVELSW
jgi:hypothetical protein